MWNIISRVGTRQFQNPPSDVFFFSLSLFFLLFLFHPFSLAASLSLSSLCQTLFPWDGRPSVLQGLRDQWDALFSDYFSQKNTTMHEGLFFSFFCLSSSTKIWCCCYALPRLGWADLIWNESCLSCWVFLKIQKTKAHLKNLLTHVWFCLEDKQWGFPSLRVSSSSFPLMQQGLRLAYLTFGNHLVYRCPMRLILIEKHVFHK